ncbi:NAD(P)/FAD-dependent oxidoreductase [Acidovorax sp. SDU_ACID1]|uniref:NAD(P)/FAD-dependent oxidoreductase n=1 Tax=Acidovorax sp. SDU_ACID1 TaxID=3136632 RepID=UPI0038739852
MKNIVILGAGHAGCQLAFALRENGFQGNLTLVNGENALPYHRPPLSKGFLKNGRRDGLLLRGENAFADHGISLVVDVAREIRPASREVQLESGALLPYDHLALALGTLNRSLDIPGGDKGVVYLKSLADAETLRARLIDANTVVIIGAGFIGLEVAALAASEAKVVHVIDLADRVMARTASEEISGYFQRRHQEAGVLFHLGARIIDVVRNGSMVSGVSLSTGETIEADLVVAGLGVIPHTAMAQAAGLAVDNGIVVDEYLASNDPYISAIGDCARFPTPHASCPIRLESIQNAHDHARNLAKRLTGDAQPYTVLPWFWSDQGDDKLQIAGLPGVADQRVLRGSPEQKRFSVFSFRGGQLFAVESVNQATDHMLARKLISTGTKVSPEMVADMNVRLADLINHKGGAAHVRATV